MKIVPTLLFNIIAKRPDLHKIIHNIGWLYFDKILKMGVGFFVTIWLARYLGPNQFGTLSFAHAFVGLFGVIAGLGLQSIVVRDIVSDPECQNETIGSAAAMMCVAGFITYGLLLTIIFLLRPEDSISKALVMVIGSIILFKSSDAVIYWFESQVQSRFTVWAQNSAFLIFAVVKLALILGDAPLIAFAWAVMGEALLGAIILFIILGTRGPRLRQLRISFVRVKALLNDSWPLLISSMAIMVYMRIDQIMLGEMIGDEAVGIFSVAVRISEIWYFIPTSILASLFPAIIEARSRDINMYYERLQHLSSLMVLVSISITVLIFFLASPTVSILFGKPYAEAAQVISIYIWSLVFVSLGVISSQWAIAEKRQMLSLQRTSLGLIVNIVLNYTLIPRFGVLGAAWSTFIAQFLVGFLFDLLQKETRHLFTIKIRSFSPYQIIRLFRGK